MSRIDAVLRSAGRLLVLGRFVRFSFVALAVVGVVLVVWRALSWLGLVAGGSWGLGWVWAWCVGLGLGLGVAWLVAWVGRPDRLAVARMLDDRGGLSERLSTAVWLESVGGGDGGESRAEGAWDAAAMRDAERASGRVEPRALVGVRVPRWWWSGVVLAGLFLAIGVVPGVGGGGGSVGVDGEIERAAEEAEDLVASARRELRESAAGSPEAREALERLEDPALESLRVEDPEAYRREALKRVSEAKLELESMASSPEAAADSAAREKLASMRVRTPLRDPDFERLARALQRGDFDAARAARGALEARIVGEIAPRDPPGKVRQSAHIA